MLSLESIEQRLDNPKACYVFYDCFHKAAVGEVRWKECMDSSDERIGNDTTEAFALLLHANNHKAWLCDEKLMHGDKLRTEHESESNGKDSIMDKLLKGQEFVLDEDAETMLVVRDSTKESHKKAVKDRKDELAKFRRLPACAEMKSTWHLTTGDEEANENETNAQELGVNKKEQKKKRGS
jgi:hypothetical protein